MPTSLEDVMSRLPEDRQNNIRERTEELIRQRPEYAEIEAKARALVYRTIYAEAMKGNMVSLDLIDEMIQRVIRDMGY